MLNNGIRWPENGTEESGSDQRSINANVITVKILYTSWCRKLKGRILTKECNDLCFQIRRSLLTILVFVQCFFQNT